MTSPALEKSVWPGLFKNDQRKLLSGYLQKLTFPYLPASWGYCDTGAGFFPADAFPSEASEQTLHPTNDNKIQKLYNSMQEFIKK